MCYCLILSNPNTGYKSGRPSCCGEPGGDVMNCPIGEPPCDTDLKAADGAAAAKTVNFLRAN